jgi:hypothetical protein
MAFLFHRTRQTVLNDQFQDIQELKRSIFGVRAETATIDHLVNNAAEVAGDRNGARVAVVHLPMSGRTFHETVMAGGDTHDDTLGRLDEVAAKIQRFD